MLLGWNLYHFPDDALHASGSCDQDPSVLILNMLIQVCAVLLSHSCLDDKTLCAGGVP